ncbi:hypothetical protein KI387_007603, partial [Taxus chinensis]
FLTSGGQISALGDIGRVLILVCRVFQDVDTRAIHLETCIRVFLTWAGQDAHLVGLMTKQ